MKLSVQRRAIYYVGLVIALLIIASCNGGGGGGGGTTGPSADAPVVTNFQIRAQTSEKAFTAGRYLITATVTDPNNDLLGGRVEVREPGHVVSATIDATGLQGNTLTLTYLTNPVPAGRYNLVFVVIDAAGHESNQIPFFITITAQVPSRTAPGRISDRLMPAR